MTCFFSILLLWFTTIAIVLANFQCIAKKEIPAKYEQFWFGPACMTRSKNGNGVMRYDVVVNGH